MALVDITLNSLEEADKFVNKTRNTRWDGWDIITFVPNERAYMHKRGTYNRVVNRWGFEYKYPVTEQGTWNVKAYRRG